MKKKKIYVNDNNSLIFIDGFNGKMDDGCVGYAEGKIRVADPYLCGIIVKKNNNKKKLLFCLYPIDIKDNIVR